MTDNKFKNDEEMILVSSEEGLENLDIESMLKNNKEDSEGTLEPSSIENILGIPIKPYAKKSKRTYEPLMFVFATEDEEQTEFELIDIVKTDVMFHVTLLAKDVEFTKLNLFGDNEFYLFIKDSEDNCFSLFSLKKRIINPSVKKTKDGRYKLNFNIYLY